MSSAVYVINRKKVENELDDIPGGINIFSNGNLLAANVSQLSFSTGTTAVIDDKKIKVTAAGGGGSLSYYGDIVWSGVGPYTFTITNATHGCGATNELDVSIFEGENEVSLGNQVAADGTVTLTSSVNFANGKILIKN